MSLKEKDKTLPESQSYILWTPGDGRSVAVGADRQPLPLTRVPLPVHREELAAGEPSDDAIGQGVYDYLRQFPDCPHNLCYAELLRDAFPHYLADLGAQIVMLEHKEVDAPYLRRKITYMKILGLLDPDNGGLLQQLGLAFYELGLMFSELRDCRRHLLAALGCLQRSLKRLPDNLASLNHMGQIDFLIGDYPSAARRWNAVAEALEDGPSRQALSDKIAHIDAQKVPDHPLVDDLEAIGAAMEQYANGDIRGALQALERLEEEGTVPTEFPSPEFYYLLGMCRFKEGDAAGAFEAFDKALAIDPEYAPALEGKECIQEGRRP